LVNIGADYHVMVFRTW